MTSRLISRTVPLIFPLELEGLRVITERAFEVRDQLMTPENVLASPPTNPELINPDLIRDKRIEMGDIEIKVGDRTLLKSPSAAEVIFELREEIRRLELVPIKNQPDQDYYHTFTKADLVTDLKIQMGHSSFMFSVNRFPYLLPVNITQGILWLSGNPSRLDVAEIIVKIMLKLGLQDDQVICFDRPIGVDIKFVRGSMPDIRHIHIWYENALDSNK